MISYTYPLFLSKIENYVVYAAGLNKTKDLKRKGRKNRGNMKFTHANKTLHSWTEKNHMQNITSKQYLQTNRCTFDLYASSYPILLSMNSFLHKLH